MHLIDYYSQQLFSILLYFFICYFLFIYQSYICYYYSLCLYLNLFVFYCYYLMLIEKRIYYDFLIVNLWWIIIILVDLLIISYLINLKLTRIYNKLSNFPSFFSLNFIIIFSFSYALFIFVFIVHLMYGSMD